MCKVSRSIRQTRLIFRSFGALYYLPSVVVLVLVPLISHQYMATVEDADLCLRSIWTTMQQLMPIASLWWLYLIQREKLEGDGRELFCAYQPGWRTPLAEHLLCLGWYWLHLAVVVLLHGIWLAGMSWALLQLLGESLFFAGSYLLLSGLTGSSSISLLFLLTYYFMTTFFSASSPIAQLSVLTLGELPSPQLLTSRYGVVALLGGVFFLAGTWLSGVRRLHR